MLPRVIQDCFLNWIDRVKYEEDFVYLLEVEANTAIANYPFFFLDI